MWKIQDFPTDDYDLKKMVSGQPDVEKFSLVRVNDITHSFIALYRDLHIFFMTFYLEFGLFGQKRLPLIASTIFFISIHTYRHIKF